MAAPVYRPSQSPHGGGTFLQSFGHAWNGLLHTVQHQRNMRLHWIAALLVGQVGTGVPLGLAEKVTLIFCVLLVFFAEMQNTAIEQMVDLATSEIDQRAKLSKDIAAAAVLVLGSGAVTIFAAILVHNADTIFADLNAIERQAAVGVPLVFFGGALMHEGKKPAWLDVIFVIGALITWGWSLRWTESYVFSAMTLGLLVVCTNVAWNRHHGTYGEN